MSVVKLDSKSYDLSNNKDRTEYWTKYVADKLIGRTIVKIEYMSSREAVESMWYSRPVCILLDNGKWLYPMRDDEGNDGGAIGIASKDGGDTFPVLGVEDSDNE
tara:strand:+ start:6487 stop:6798 length:312 start_codon:yes stop_codon:yes gene_type:complete